MENYPSHLHYKPELKYISGIGFISSKSAIKTTGPNFIPQDLNQGARGKFIYAVKEWTASPQEAVTGLAFVQNEQAVPMGFVRINQDLNQGAGGAYNYLCVQKGYGARIIDIDIVAFDSPFVFDIYGQWRVFRQDLNYGAKKRGKYIYLMFKTE